MAAATGPYTFTVRDPTGVATCATLPNAIGVTISGSGTSTLVITGDAANNALMQTDFYITSSAPANELGFIPYAVEPDGAADTTQVEWAA